MNRLSELMLKVMHHMVYVNEKILSENDYCEFLSLCAKDIGIIDMVGGSDIITARQISIKSNSPKSTIVSAVSRLEKRGYIIRQKNPQDGREQFLALTSKGDAVNRLHHRYEEEYLKEFLDLFCREDYTILQEVLERSKICNTTE